MFNSHIKRCTIFLAVPILALAVLHNVPARTGTMPQAEDTAAYYKSKCAVCHGAKADKKFDPSLPDAEMVEAILKGKKAEKPPHMPEYQTKGVSEEQAQALVNYMKKLREPAE